MRQGDIGPARSSGVRSLARERRLHPASRKWEWRERQASPSPLWPSSWDREFLDPSASSGAAPAIPAIVPTFSTDREDHLEIEALFRAYFLLSLFRAK